MLLDQMIFIRMRRKRPAISVDPISMVFGRTRPALCFDVELLFSHYCGVGFVLEGGFGVGHDGVGRQGDFNVLGGGPSVPVGLIELAEFDVPVTKVFFAVFAGAVVGFGRRAEVAEGGCGISACCGVGEVVGGEGIGVVKGIVMQRMGCVCGRVGVDV